MLDKLDEPLKQDFMNTSIKKKKKKKKKKIYRHFKHTGHSSNDLSIQPVEEKYLQ